MIRKATLSDLPEIVSIYNESIPSRLATAEITPVSVEDRQEWFLKHDALRPIWVFETNLPRGKKVLGWLSFTSFYGRPAYRGTVEVSIYISTSARGRGVGSQLWSEALVQMPALKVRTVMAFIFSHNKNSIDFFKKAGFVEWGRFPQIAEMDSNFYDLSIYGFSI